jgi:hypothetical protein
MHHVAQAGAPGVSAVVGGRPHQLGHAGQPQRVDLDQRPVRRPEQGHQAVVLLAGQAVLGVVDVAIAVPLRRRVGQPRVGDRQASKGRDVLGGELVAPEGRLGHVAQDFLGPRVLEELPELGVLDRTQVDGLGRPDVRGVREHQAVLVHLQQAVGEHPAALGQGFFILGLS